MKRQPELELNKEYPSPNEDVLTERLVTLIKEMLKKSYVTGTTYRDTHAKGHVAVRGEFIVAPDLTPELRVGLFKEASSYPCWIRFANTSPTPNPDIKRDIRSMSLKLIGVKGKMLWQDADQAETLDLLLMGAKTFLAPNLEQFYQLEIALNEGGLRGAWFFLTHWPITWTIITKFTKCANLFEVPYWSQTAYLFGTRAVQYHIRPHLPATSTIPSHPTTNYLRERLIEQLARTDAAFDFMIQFQTDPYKMPIENPLVAWDERLSPYIKVATIRIPSQPVEAQGQQRVFCENLSFNPWRTLPEHRPLGGINRARKEVYPAISNFRHDRNAAPLTEPTADERF